MEIATMHDMSNTRKEIAARLGFAAGNGAKAEFGNVDRLESLMAACYRALKNNDKAAAKRLMADAAKEIDENTPSYILAEYKDLKKGMSRPGAKAEFGGMKGLGDWTVGFTDVMQEKIAQLKQLAKSLKATVTLGRVSPNGMYSGTVSRKYGPMEPPDFTASTKVKQLIKSLGGYENDSWRYNARPGAKESFGRAEDVYRLLETTPGSYANYKKRDALVTEAMRLADITPAGKDVSLHELAEMVGQDLEADRSRMSRPGAKTRMTREQTEEQKAGLKIMSAADPAVGAKIATLIKEGKPQDQAVAIALDMKRRGEL